MVKSFSIECNNVILTEIVTITVAFMISFVFLLLLT